MCAWLIDSQSSAFHHPSTVQSWPLTCLCGNGTSTAMTISSWHFSSSKYLYPPSTYSMVGHDHPLIHGALHGTPMHFCCGYMLFACMNTVPLYGLSFLNNVPVTMISAWDMFVPSCMYVYTPHLMVTFTSMSHAFKHVHYTPFDGHFYKYVPCFQTCTIYSIWWSLLQVRPMLSNMYIILHFPQCHIFPPESSCHDWQSDTY
jgi:hypothetical protein